VFRALDILPGVVATGEFSNFTIHAGEDFERTVQNALESEDLEDVAIGESEQDSTLLGVTWGWSPSEVAQLRNTFY
jgi:hypothetical protein